MPYVTEGPTGEVAQTDMIKHLFGVKGPSGFGSASTAEKVAKNWDGSGKVSWKQQIHAWRALQKQCLGATYDIYSANECPCSVFGVVSL
jgi:hypothetical protein